MKVGDVAVVSGYVTQLKFIAGRTLSQIEQLLGFQRLRLAAGATAIGLSHAPLDFDLAGYSTVAEHRMQPASGVDIEKIKAIARRGWTVSGSNRLVKIRAIVPHDPDMDPDIQYPPGQGVPQWKLTAPQMGTVLAVVGGYPDGRLEIAASQR